MRTLYLVLACMLCLVLVPIQADDPAPSGDRKAQLTYHDGLQDGQARMMLAAVSHLMRAHTDSMKIDRKQTRESMVRSYLRVKDQFPSPSTRYEQGWKDGVEKVWQFLSF